MANIINIFHTDVLPAEVPPEYEMLGANGITGIGGDSEVLLYRRGLRPAVEGVTHGSRVRIPMIPLHGPCANYKTNGEIKREVKKFISDAIPVLKTRKLRVTDALREAEKALGKYGSYIYHILYSPDMANRISPAFDYIPESRCIEMEKHKNTIIILPEPVFTGIMSIREPKTGDFYLTPYGHINRTSVGMMLSKDHVFMFTDPS